MKKLFLVLILTISAFALDLTFTKAFNNFNKGTRFEQTDKQKANQYFQKAFFLIQQMQHKDTSQVNYMLGEMYSNGWGIEQNYQKAEKYFLKAINLGNVRANCSLAKLYIQMGKSNLARKYLNYALSYPSVAHYCKDISQNNLTIKGETK